MEAKAKEFRKKCEEKGFKEETIDKLISEDIISEEDLIDFKDDVEELATTRGEVRRLKRWIRDEEEGQAEVKKQKLEEKAKTIAKKNEAAIISPMDIKPKALGLYEEKKALISWKNLARPAPLSLCLLGQMVVAAESQPDFSYKDYIAIDVNSSTKEGFQTSQRGRKLLRYHDSFKTSLVQICNDSWQAFSEAHNTMHRIQLNANNIFRDIQTIASVNKRCSLKEIALWTEQPANDVKDAAKECAELCEKAAQGSDNVLCVVVALSEICTFKKESSVKRQEKIESTRKLVSLEEKAAKEAAEKAEKELEHYDKNCKELEGKLLETINDAPTAKEYKRGFWKRLFLDSDENKELNEAREAHNHKVDQQKEAMRSLDEKKEKQRQIQEEQNQKLHDALKAMSSLDMENADVEKVKEALEIGMKGIRSVSASWKDLSNAFKEITNVIEKGIVKQAHSFGKQLKNVNSDISTEGKNFLLAQAVIAAMEAKMAAKDAKIYCELSNQHILPRASELEKLSNSVQNGDVFTVLGKVHEITDAVEQLPDEINVIINEMENEDDTVQNACSILE